MGEEKATVQETIVELEHNHELQDTNNKPS